MSETKWTPGPWSVVYDDNGFFFISAKGMPSPFLVATGGEGETDKANADIASAAPDMYRFIEMACGALELMSKRTVNEGVRKTLGEMIAEGRELQRKARGEQS